MYTLHRILGTLLSVLFLVWFLSAFVMMYHGFPRVSVQERLEKQEALTTKTSASGLLPFDTVLSRLPVQASSVRGIELKRIDGQTVFNIRTSKDTYVMRADTVVMLPSEASQSTAEDILQTASLWCNAPISSIDTLSKLDQWIPFGQLKKELPVYKFHFADDEQHQLYISSQSGEVLQFTSHDERFWAWLGAIPHWVYFTWLRQDLQLWKTTVIWLSGIGCLMVIAGLWIGIDVWRKTRRRRAGGFSPYKKKWYHWHYVTGIVFGIFVLTFTFSGMMSLADLPTWITHPTMSVNPMKAFRQSAPSAYEIPLDYRQVLAQYPEAKVLEWSNFRSHPYYTVKETEAEYYIDATDSLPRPLHLSKEEVEEAVRAVYQTEDTAAHTLDRPHAVALRTELLDHYETDYRDMSRMYKGRSLLPVWKVTAADADHSVYYIHPETGAVRYVNTTARWKYWTYTALHRLRIPGLNSNVTLRKTVLWVLLLGGTAVSVTGIVLGVNYLCRLGRRRNKKHS